MNGRDAEAEQVLINLHSDPTDPTHDVARAEFYQIQKQIAIDRTLGSSWIQMFRKPSYRKRAAGRGHNRDYPVLGRAGHQQLRTESLLAVGVQHCEAVAVSGSMVDVCSGDECAGHVLCRIPSLSLHSLCI